jgi:polysaccharide export outer membrane protein
VALCGGTLILSGCASSAPPVTESTNKLAAGGAETEYRIGVDDRLQITVWKNPDLSMASVPVRPDGKISMPLIGDVEVGGHTPEEVSDTIKTKLAVYIREPNVAVILTDLRSHEFLSRIRVTGAVHTPRSLTFRQGMTVLDAVLEAGGANDFAAPNRTKLYRKNDKDKAKTDVYDVELGDIFNKGKLETNYPLLPGDVITVPERLF